MARYKTIDTSPRFLAVDLDAQLLPGTFEHALHHLLDHDIDLLAFDARFANDETGAPAYFRGAERDCVRCALRDQCLRKPETTKTRQVAFFKPAPTKSPHTQRMRLRIDSPEGLTAYGRRFATVEPVFANLRHNKKLARFTLRGRVKVDAQWKLFCLVHNIEKLAHHGYGQQGRKQRRCEAC